MIYQPIVGNKAVEDAAIDWVMALEREAGRQPIDRRHDPGFAADIASPPRTIEVKAVGKDQRGWFVPIETRQYEAALSNADFFLYVIDNITQGDKSAFRLKVFGGETLKRLLGNAKKREYYEMPIPVAEFDAAPGKEAILELKPASAGSRDARLAEFGEAMVDIYRNAKKRAGYDAKIFLQMVIDRGGFETARYLLWTDKPSYGYTALYELGRLDLTVEALVIQPEWADLFSDEDRARARVRLRDYGFDVA